MLSFAKASPFYSDLLSSLAHFVLQRNRYSCQLSGHFTVSVLISGYPCVSSVDFSFYITLYLLQFSVLKMSTSQASSTVSRKLAQQIFNKQNLKYLFTTHFWGPVSNFGIPVAAIVDLKNKPADTISGPMTLALTVYSAIFMKYSLAITPKNYLLLGCHIINEFAQLGQGARFINYHYLTKHDDTKPIKKEKTA